MVNSISVRSANQVMQQSNAGIEELSMSTHRGHFREFRPASVYVSRVARRRRSDRRSTKVGCRPPGVPAPPMAATRTPTSSTGRNPKVYNLLVPYGITTEAQRVCPSASMDAATLTGAGMSAVNPEQDCSYYTNYVIMNANGQPGTYFASSGFWCPKTYKLVQVDHSTASPCLSRRVC